MENAIAFGAAFIAECFGALYTIALSRDKWKLAIAASFLLGAINWGIFLLVIDNHALVLPSILGEVLGTAFAMRLANRIK